MIIIIKFLNYSVSSSYKYNNTFVKKPCSSNTEIGKTWREEVKAGVEKAAPEYVVVFFHQFSWSYKPDDDQDLFKYGLDYVRKNNYDLVGVADIASNTKPILVWETAAQTYKPQGKFYVQLFRKK